jgi:hypothetical protein
MRLMTNMVVMARPFLDRGKVQHYQLSMRVNCSKSPSIIHAWLRLFASVHRAAQTLCSIPVSI